MPNLKFAINGFGRIGRSSFRVWLKRFQDSLDLVAINTSGSMPVSGWAHLAKYDTAYRTLDIPLDYREVKPPDKATDEDPLIGYFILGKKDIPILAQRDPEKLPWGKYQPDAVIESTGVFRTQEEAGKHLTAGAKLVIISAPAKGGNTPTSVIGVNHQDLLSAPRDRTNSLTVISNASCTTNCVAPVAAVMHAKLGVKKAVLNTIHGYTDDQNLQDNSHKDLRRARAASANIVPTSTGAALATTETIPDLKGLFDGIALRVPVITASITDFTFLTQRTTSVDEVNQMFIDASQSPLYRHILAVTQEPLVSSDIIGRPESAIVDLELTRVVDGDLVKIMAWYDNEWGYANRLIEQVVSAGESLS
ncbi:type I glyceraldehyde-3-phosphate dehydrogenase [Candidatus Chazhemtobacterium aquaticus]|uniref:NAD-dependent glyceraldehyde-3-phosphate dehydrogenase n=1 Tax=Candidatus Chazhemtobacterium aquaticus TaxID=2715735 RepID=A0A857N5B3_9BACT|nr:glyceraldehyde 3-phosphate dehydrogenase NAD-binding domain-containing protein [Candidatus Chazhemtobacterium aquaticus]QHO63226.1 NAD-dependent glyceraldehyde-3-phosphate dehydrogenase [Candidatus Chazhemtobacterium aquaticus]